MERVRIDNLIVQRDQRHRIADVLEQPIGAVAFKTHDLAQGVEALPVNPERWAPERDQRAAHLVPPFEGEMLSFLVNLLGDRVANFVDLIGRDRQGRWLRKRKRR